MLDGLYRLGSSLMLEDRRQELIAQNLAGSNLPGFKARYLTSSPFTRTLADAGGRDPVFGTQPGRVFDDLTQGELERTGRPLDMAIQGNGFFTLTTADGAQLLTRNGTFVRAADGTITSHEGHALLGEAGPLRLQAQDDANTLQVAADGTVTVRGVDGAMVERGKLRLSRTESLEGCERVTANYWSVPRGVRLMPADNCQVLNGWREGANSSPLRQMASMIESVREFESAQRMLRMVQDTVDQQQKMNV